MVGDVNLFCLNAGEALELEVMIADLAARRKGLAAESLKLIILFAIREQIFSLLDSVKIQS